MAAEKYDQLSIDRINKILMSARFAKCSYDSEETLKQLETEVKQEKNGQRHENNSFVKNEKKMLFRRFKSIKYQVEIVNAQY